MPSTTRLLKYFAAGAGLAALALVVYTQVLQAPSDTHQAHAQQEAPVEASGSGVGDAEMNAQAPDQAAGQAAGQTTGQNTGQASDWTVGDLRPNGLRIKPSGRDDALAVLDPSQFARSEVRRAYQIATEIPEVINRLYCWCGCENRGVHRSNLACFEDRMAVNCDVCRGTAEIASRMTKKGVTDAGKIQAAVDLEWGPEWAQQEQKNRQK